MQLAQSESHSKAPISRLNIDLLVIQICLTSFIILKEENKIYTERIFIIQRSVSIQNATQKMIP